MWVEWPHHERSGLNSSIMGKFAAVFSIKENLYVKYVFLKPKVLPIVILDDNRSVLVAKISK